MVQTTEQSYLSPRFRRVVLLLRRKKADIRFDILITSGARPGLLEQTLSSFQENLFRNVSPNTCFINIDPFEGGKEEIELCEEICGRYFDRVIAHKPAKSHFTKAVKWLWSSPETDWCLHIEDDWMLRRPVELDEILAAMKRNVVQISFMTKEKLWTSKSKYHYAGGRRKILGIDIGRGLDKTRPVFGTSPSFLRTEFAKHCASLMDDTLDPEKQLHRHNPALNEYTRHFRNRFLGSPEDHVALDIGREHRSKLGIEKKTVQGRSEWMNIGDFDSQKDKIT